MERVNRKIGILFITLFILLAQASLSFGGKSQLSVDDQKKFDELNRQLEEVKAKGGENVEKRLNLYKEMEKLKPGDQILTYYIEELNKRIIGEQASTDLIADDDPENKVEPLALSDQGSKEVSLAKGPGKPAVLKSESDFQADAQKLCSTRWTHLGHVNQTFYKRCLKIQATGYQTLKKFHTQYSNKQVYLDILLPYCQTKWTKYGVADAHMIAHCLKTDVAGFKQVLEYREKYNENEVMKIAENALLQYGSWKIAAYKVKRHFR